MSTNKSQTPAHVITVRFAGDSGDGMQLTGSQFTETSALMGNDFATFPDYPAEIRAPAGTLPGVSSFQVQFADTIVFTPGDLADVLVAMNPAALKVNLHRVKAGGLLVINENTFDERQLRKAAWTSNPLEDGTLRDFQVMRVPLTDLTVNALADHELKSSEVQRCKNFFALGMMFWLYDRTLDHSIEWISNKFSKRPEIVAANIAVLKAGYHFADISEAMPMQYQVGQAALEPGTYRTITGNQALSIGLVVASHLSGKRLFYGSYPITPASSILHELVHHRDFGVMTFQAEDEIAAVGAAIGAAYGGELGVCGTSGPGMCLKAEAMNLAVMAELPLVVVSVQRAGPSTGMPTKTEQADLLQVMFGRNGESPVVVIAPRTPSDCFDMAIEAVRIALTHMTPVVLLSEGYLAEAAEPWKLPAMETLQQIHVEHPSANADTDADDGEFMPYARDPDTLARPWAVPGTPGLEHRIGGLAKAHLTGNVSYDPANNQQMVEMRAEKVQRVANDIPQVEVSGQDQGRLLVVGWGGTYGSIQHAISELADDGVEVSHVHLRYLNPFPRNLGEVLQAFDTVLVPELNTGQLVMLMRNAFPDVRVQGLNKIQGQPFTINEIVGKIKEILDTPDGGASAGVTQGSREVAS